MGAELALGERLGGQGEGMRRIEDLKVDCHSLSLGRAPAPSSLRKGQDVLHSSPRNIPGTC